MISSSVRIDIDASRAEGRRASARAGPADAGFHSVSGPSGREVARARDRRASGKNGRRPQHGGNAKMIVERALEDGARIRRPLEIASKIERRRA
jgi:hypothetical protein